MANPKLTRAEKNVATEGRILDAARTVFGERGFHGASMDDIAADAGLSKGALYYRYAAKEDLFLALLECWARDRTERLAGVLTNAGVAAASTGIRAQKAADQLVEALAGDDDWSRLHVEFVARANHDPEFAGRLAEHTRATRAEITAVVEARAADLGVEFPLSAERLAVLIGALAAGVGTERLADGDGVPDDVLGSAITLLFSGVSLAARRLPAAG